MTGKPLPALVATRFYLHFLRFRVIDVVIAVITALRRTHDIEHRANGNGVRNR